jgi:hypothetical protein
VWEIELDEHASPRGFLLIVGALFADDPLQIHSGDQSGEKVRHQRVQLESSTNTAVPGLFAGLDHDDGRSGAELPSR